MNPRYRTLWSSVVRMPLKPTYAEVFPHDDVDGEPAARQRSACQLPDPGCVCSTYSAYAAKTCALAAPATASDR